MTATTTTERLEYNCLFEYKQLKICKDDWLYSPLFDSADKKTKWRLQINRSHSKQIGIYLTLVAGAPCTLRSYTLSITTNSNPPLIMFISKCTQQRVFPSNNFSWGFENFCTRREFKDERHLIRHPQTKLINVQCIMHIEVNNSNNLNDDHRLATDLFETHPLQYWIDLLKQRDDLPELTNRVNQEIEARFVG